MKSRFSSFIKQRFVIFLIAITISSLLGALIETLIFNFRPLTLNPDNQSIPAITYETSISNNQTTITANLDGHYLRKLIINYQTSTKTNITLSYNYAGTYGEITSQQDTFLLSPAFTSVTKNIDQDVQTLTITYTNPTNISTSNSNDDSADSAIAFSILNLSADNDFHFNPYRWLTVSLTIFLVFLLFYFYKTGFKTEKLHIYFATIGTILGAIFVIIQPATVCCSWDDQIHFERTLTWYGDVTYNTSEFLLSDSGLSSSDCSGVTIIDSFEDQIAQNTYLNTILSDGVNHPAGNNPTDYDRLGYLPMAIGYHGAKLFHLPFTLCFKFGKFINLLVYVLLMAYAIKTLITGKRLLTVIALIPLNFFLATQYSYDPAVFAGITIFLVHIINLLLDKTKKFDFKTAVIMILAISYTCVTKAVYAPIILLTLLIPKDRFKSRKQARLVKIGLMCLMLLLASLYILPTISGTATGDNRVNDTSPIGQLSFVASHPLDFASILYHYIVECFSSFFLSPNTFSFFAYLNGTGLSANFYYIFFIFLLFVFFTDNEHNSLTKLQRFSILGSSLLIIILIWVALYFSFNPVGATSIEGVQNRYFLCLLFPLFFALQPKNIKNHINPKLYNTLTLAIPTLVLLAVIYQILLIPYGF